MAHIKVVRRSMRPEEWTQLRFGWLKRHIYSKKWEIKNLMIRDARQTSEMNFDYYSDDYRPLNKGDMYFTPDGTAFIKADVDIPQDMQGKNSGFLSKPRLKFASKSTANMSAALTRTESVCSFHRISMIKNASFRYDGLQPLKAR